MESFLVIKKMPNKHAIGLPDGVILQLRSLSLSVSSWHPRLVITIGKYMHLKSSKESQSGLAMRGQWSRNVNSLLYTCAPESRGGAGEEGGELRLGFLSVALMKQLRSGKDSLGLHFQAPVITERSQEGTWNIHWRDAACWFACRLILTIFAIYSSGPLA